MGLSPKNHPLKSTKNSIYMLKPGPRIKTLPSCSLGFHEYKMVNVPAQAILSEALPTYDIVTTPKGLTKVFVCKKGHV